MHITRLNFQVLFDIEGQTVTATLPTGSPTNGFIAYGTHNYGHADFDNFKVNSTRALPAV